MTSALMLRLDQNALLIATIAVILPYVQNHVEHDEGSGGQGGSQAPVVMISMDGFRYDYLNRMPALVAAKGVENMFGHLASTGVWATQGVENVFATKTFPNHYSLVTGLYEETHGVVENFIFDQRLNRTVRLTDPNEQRAEYFHGTPIWVDYGRQKSPEGVACFMWVGCNLPIDNFTLINKVDYSDNATCDQQVEWLGRQMKDGVQLTLMYLNEPDLTGHKYGPDSVELNNTLMKLNECLERLLAVVPHSANFLLVSDHGMSKLVKDVSITIKDDLFWVRGQDYTEWLIDPKPGNEQATIDHLRTYEAKGDLKVYRKEEIPERWHYGHNIYVSSVLVVAEPGVRLLPAGDGLVGGHGYDNALDEMRPMFLAKGPNLAKNVTLEKDAFRTLDVYLLMAVLLGLEPSPNNGSCSNVHRVLSANAFRLLAVSCHQTSSLIPLIISALVMIFGVCLFIAHRYRLKRGQQSLRDHFGLNSADSALPQRYFYPAGRKSNKSNDTAALLTTEVSDDEDDLFAKNLLNNSVAADIGDSDL